VQKLDVCLWRKAVIAHRPMFDKLPATSRHIRPDDGENRSRLLLKRHGWQAKLYITL